MKARLAPLYFASGTDSDYKAQLETVAALLANEADILPPTALGSTLPDADAALFPQLIGDAFKQLGRAQAREDILLSRHRDPDNHALIVHCGYFGLLPRAFSTEWKLEPKVPAIVDDNATAINARLPIGPITMSKLDPHLKRLQILPSVLESYAGYPGSDCRNGGIVRVRDGRALMDRLYSHHQIFTTGDRSVELKIAAKAYGLETEII